MVDKRPPLRLPDIHILPPKEEGHELSPVCYCCPIIEFQDETGRRTWYHHGKDEAN